MKPRHCTSITARGYELDSYHHVNNAVYLNYFEHARWEYFRALGLVEILRGAGNLPVVVDVQIRFQREIRLFDSLRIETMAFTELPYLVFRQRIIRESDQMPMARATTKLIFTGDKNLPMDIPQEVLAKIGI